MNNTLSLHSISVSDMDNNCYLICCGDEALLVDAADDAPAILQLAADKGVKITALLTSHRHWDHVRATKDIIKATGATHYASFLDSLHCPHRSTSICTRGTRFHSPAASFLQSSCVATPQAGPRLPWISMARRTCLSAIHSSQVA